MKRICDIAAKHLRSTNNAGVMATDGVLLRQIANLAGIESNGWKTEKRILDALTKTPGELVPAMTRGYKNRLVRCFRIPEQ